MTSPILAKTDDGQRELRERGRSLARPARTLLVLADGQRTADELLAMVQGATPADVQTLLVSGLVQARGAPAAHRPSASAAPVAQVAVALAEPADLPDLLLPDAADVAPAPLGYRELYDGLNALVKEQLGLLRGYKFALEIEKASSREDLLSVAERFAAEVQQRKGEAAGKVVRRALGLTA